jgi:NAD(P)-dependent dehydrogenase (short-subunit alcohol dehydrogenase family)
MFTTSLADRLTRSTVTPVCVYPGLVATDLLRERWWWRAIWLRPVWRAIFLRPEDAAQAVIAAATSSTPAGDSPCCFTLGGRQVAVPSRARDPEARRRLWNETVRLVGVDF